MMFFVSDLGSLAMNSVECVMDQERNKGDNPNDTIGDNMAEHNYTNTGDSLVTITRLSPTSRQSTPVFRNILPKVGIFFYCKKTSISMNF